MGGRGRWEVGKKRRERRNHFHYSIYSTSYSIASVSFVKISSHLVRGLSIFLYSSEVFFRPVSHYQWHWMKYEEREGRREGRREGSRDGG